MGMYVTAQTFALIRTPIKCSFSVPYSNNLKTVQSKEHLTITLIVVWLILGLIPAEQSCFLPFEKFSFRQRSLVYQKEFEDYVVFIQITKISLT